jgi:hypothetical protein
MTERPFVLWKCAASLDGRIAAADGSSKWITSAEARADGHRLRAECGAVMVGSGTQQADDPQLAVRDAEATRQPLRIIVDSNARTPASARVLDDAAPTLIAVADDADASHLEGGEPCFLLRRWGITLGAEEVLGQAQCGDRGRIVEFAGRAQRDEARQRHASHPDRVPLITRTPPGRQLTGQEHELAQGQMLERVKLTKVGKLVGVPAKLFLEFAIGGQLQRLVRLDHPTGEPECLAVQGRRTLDRQQHVAVIIKGHDEHAIIALDEPDTVLIGSQDEVRITANDAAMRLAWSVVHPAPNTSGGRRPPPRPVGSRTIWP